MLFSLFNTAFTGTAVVTSAFGFDDLLEYLICIALFLIGTRIIKRSTDKKIKTVGILIASVGVFLLLWLLVWQIVAHVVYLSY